MASSVTLPNFVVISSYYHTDSGNAQYNSVGSVFLGEKDVFSTAVKIAVEPSTRDRRYVHLRFCYSNKYWARNPANDLVVATSMQPVEDTEDPACTLFQAVDVTAADRVFYFEHVQSGGRVKINDPTTALFVDPQPAKEDGYFIYVDWELLVKMPAHVAFKGDNDKYLQAIIINAASVQQFASSDPNEKASGYQVSQLPDGRVQITSDNYGKMWWSGAYYEERWVYGDWSAQWDSASAIFTPHKISDSTIALASNGPYSGNNFCARITGWGRTDCLSPSASTITNEARLVVQELVLQRTIYNVIYNMDSARIYDEKPFTAGSTVLVNNSSEAATMAVQITYQDEVSYTFSSSLSITAGVTTAFEAGLPFIAKNKVEVSFEINTTLGWDTTTTTTTSVTASGSISVPANTSAVIGYVGKIGTCDVPFSYTQKDVRSTDANIAYSDHDDGIYTGVNSYNFSFKVTSTTPL